MASFYIPEGMDERGIAQPTGREIAKYGGRGGAAAAVGYELDDASRREFLRYLGAGIAYAATVNLQKTLKKAGLVGGTGVSLADCGGGNGNLSGPTPIEQYPGDITLFREMCLGINSPYPFGGAPINNGKSVRLRDGINPRLIIVRNPNAVDAEAKYSAIADAFPAFSEFTKGILTPSKGEPDYVDSKPDPSVLPEGAVVYYFEGSGAGTFTNKNEFTVIRSWIRLPIGPVGPIADFVKYIKHENGHAIGLDHVNNQAALMWPKSLTDNDGNVTEEEKTAANWKYTHPAGYSI